MTDKKLQEPNPKGWIRTTIRVVTDDHVDSSGPSGDDTFTYVDISSIDNQRKCIAEPKLVLVADAPNRAKQRLKRDDTVVSMTRPNLNAVAFVRPELDSSIASTGLHVLRPFHIHPLWLYYLVQTTAFVEGMTSLVQGALYPAVRPKDILDYEMPLAPLAEQGRIVAEIEKQLTRLDAAMASLQRVRTELDRYRASILRAACEGRLVPAEAELAQTENRDYEHASQLLERSLAARRARWEQDQLQMMHDRGEEPKNNKWKQKYEEPSPPEAKDLPDVPAGWCWASIEQLASREPRSIQSGPFGSNLLHSEFQETGILAIGIDNVLDGKFSLGSQNRISAEKYEELKKYSARPLDALITVMATVGRCCVVPEETEPAIITKHVYRISVDRELVNPFYLMNALRGSASVQGQLKGGIRGQTRPGINGAILRTLAIPLPPMREQSRIVAEIDRRLSLAEALTAAVEGSVNRADRLRRSVLKRAFEGRLAPQDVSDEPASVLLDRIRTERSQAAILDEAGASKLKLGRRKMMAEDRPPAKKTIIEALTDAKAPLSPEKLFAATGHQTETIDEFYDELKVGVGVGQIEEIRTGDESVLLRVKQA